MARRRFSFAPLRHVTLPAFRMPEPPLEPAAPMRDFATTSPDEGAAARQSVWRRRATEVAAPLAVAVMLLAVCVITSARKYFWHDEVFSWLLLTDSFTHMLRVIWVGGEAAPPVYHVLGWIWTRLFGSSELAMRLFSSAGFVAAAVTLWWVLRRWYSLRAAAVATIYIFAGSRLLIYQNSEARFYGTFMALCALAVVLYAMVCAPGAERPSRRVLVATAIVHAAIVLCHIFGFLYSGAVLAALVLHDVWRRRLRPAVYLSVLAGWTAFLPWIPAFRNQSELGVPHTWIPVPDAAALQQVYRFRNPQPWGALYVIAGLLALELVRRLLMTPRVRRDATRDATRTVASPLPLLALTLLGVPVLAYVVSHVTMSIFVDRYMLPSAMGTSILLAHAIARLSAPQSSGTAMSGERRWWHLPEGGLLDQVLAFSWVVLCVVLLVRPVFRALDLPTFPRPGSEALALVPPGTPIALESPIEYLPVTHYSGAPGRPYFMILDWADALDPKATLQATVDYKLMTRWKANGYLADGIVQGSAFLCTHDRFLVVDEPQHLWFERQVKNNPAFTTRPLGDDPSYATGWIRYKRYVLVERKAGAMIPGCR